VRHLMNYSKSDFISLAIYLLLIIGAIPAIAANTVNISDLTVSPDGTLLAFSAEGDIWTVSSNGGVAHRLTLNSAEDQSPVFNPAGNLLAFSSNRHGNHDVFIMDVNGGNLKQLTFDSADDMVTQFDPKGDFVVFNSYRDFREYITWKIPVQGGIPLQLCPLESSNGKLSPDGTKFVYQKGFVDKYRQGYRGPSSSNLWLYDLSKNTTVQLTKTRWNDRNPDWSDDGNTIYYISEKNDVQNILLFNLTDGTSKQLTKFNDGLIYELTVSKKNNTVYFCRDTQITRYDENGNLQLISIEIPSDRRRLEKELTDFSTCGELCVSAEGNQLVIEHRGDLFAVDPDTGDANLLTETPFRENCPRWHPLDGSLYFIGDRTGNGEIYRLSTDNDKEKLFHKARFFKEECVVKSNVPIEFFEITPDGKRLIYLLSDGRLNICDSDGNNPEELRKGDYVYNLSISPDNKWAVYLKEFAGLHTDVWLLNLKSRQEYHVSTLHGNDNYVRFTPDGRQLVISSGYEGDDEIYAVWLSLKDHEQYFETDKKTEKETDKDKSVKEPLIVDLPNIHKRFRRLISWPSSDQMPIVTPDEKTLLFKSDAMGKFALYKAEITENSIKNPALFASINPDQLITINSSEKIYYRCGGDIGTINLSDGKLSKISIKGKMKVDRLGEYLQMYREAWSAIKYQFYDKNLHNADWDAAYTKYLPLVENARTSRELRDAIRRLTGELNASHLGIYGGDDDGIKGEQTGRTGARLGDYVRNKGYEVLDVIPDTPAYRSESRIYPGEYIYSLNRIPFSENLPIAYYFNGTVGKSVDLEIFNSKNKPKMRTITLKPVGFWKYQSKAYQYWIDKNRQMVDRLSNNKIGYLHIKSMDNRSLEKFRNDVFGLLWEKEAIIIDVRGNPGGNIHNELIRHLYGKPFGWSKPRLGELTEHPDYIWRKPSVVLIDERSFSDAEVFPNGYQALGIGKVIGMPTFGGVIGTSGFSLLNGAWFRIPWVGWYTNNDRNMEHTGAIPDIQVERQPDERLTGRDSQIERAVKELL